jgi:hypothetical protein
MLDKNSNTDLHPRSLTTFRHIVQMIQTVFVFCDWFFSLNLMTFGFIQVVACEWIAFLLKPNSTPLFVH